MLHQDTLIISFNQGGDRTCFNFVLINCYKMVSVCGQFFHEVITWRCLSAWFSCGLNDAMDGGHRKVAQVAISGESSSRALYNINRKEGVNNSGSVRSLLCHNFRQIVENTQ